MPSNRPNLTRPPQTQPDLTLDEESFQELLSAAFTIQEHNDRRRDNRQKDDHQTGDRQIDDGQIEDPKEAWQKQSAPALAEFEPGGEAGAQIFCPHCGSSKRAGESRCPHCNLDELRPGERMQRNWASMWLMSQEQGLWPERSAEVREGQQEEKPEATRRDVVSRGRERRPSTSRSASDSASSGFLTLPPASADSSLEESTAEATDFDLPIDDNSPAVETNDAMSETAFGEAPESEDRINHSQLDHSRLNHSNVFHGLSDLRVILRFHRADLYLGAAVCVAALALLWPAATLPRHHGLGLWDRTLIALGVAEAPAPAVHHFQGDPAIEVWVDPHTALYYCPSEEQYGKTADGRRSSQRDAQMERFEPAGRAACE
jgi:hypothetical protein